MVNCKYPIRFRGINGTGLINTLINIWIIYNKGNKYDSIPLIDFRTRICFAWIKKPKPVSVSYIVQKKIIGVNKL